MEKSNIDNLYYLSIESSTLSKDKYKNPSTEEIITIQYQKLDGDGYPTSDIVTLKEWESNEKTILKEFLNIYNIHNLFAFTPVDNMINYSLLTIGSRLLHYNLISRDGICNLLFNRPSINLMPILRILNNMDIRSGLIINKVARDNIPILYKNKQYNEIEKILEKKSNGMIKLFQTCIKIIPTTFKEFENVNKNIKENQNMKIKSNQEISIYTAGKMPCEGENISDTWRGKLEKLIPSAKFLHPILEGCDHSGVMPEATVKNDLDLINQSDLIIGYFDQTDLYGTITEILYAASIGKKIGLVIFKQNLSNNHDWNNNHGCSCCWESIDIGVQAHEYWFMERLFIDYLGLDSDIYKNTLIFYIDDIDYENIKWNKDGQLISMDYLNTESIINKMANEINKYTQQ